ncbi:S8 family serine peptidase [Shewanella sp. CG12_big_fil_rev_8_21_14_0_65_47_15]|uniref:S8 family serine peptidase n=1 Tax=Shewanella sp. CG12_big_fil_rev_8_21_14_0_65_47_15 TaxID=1975537 RepID=UPI000CC764AB|nr:S8 family serine peptidase [Shewanella sp. CG12_big_fil_rev_8_21_14_0_65_47_15]PIW62514.1 MAG: hypothetical protein COW15_02845 [Shewanella sp. CG12_big_fil_rev_8_21_14_0_65_47_15]
MKLKSLTVATLAALYGAGMAVSIEARPVTPSLTASAVGSQGTLKQIPADQLNRVKGTSSSKPQQQGRHSVIPGGVNQQINAASSRNKFIAEPERTGEDVYIVRLKDLPIATYDGRVKGYQATAKSAIKEELVQQASGAASTKSSRQSQQINVAQADVEGLKQSRVASYKNYLMSKQDSVVQQAKAIGVRSNVRANFTTALNGFSMTMTQAQAKQLASLPQVEFIHRSTMQQIQTDRGPAFIGADQVWAGNTSVNLPYKGEKMVVGIIDTGINTDHVAFADIGGDGYDHINPLGSGKYLGDCATGKLTCNDKLIGVYSWPVITDEYQGLAPATGEDYQGHGSHTAGTAAGNYIENVPLLAGSLGDGDGEPMGFNFESASGVAPHANIIAYQACGLEGCPEEAMLKAYEQAIEDGVDVINFSIGGGERFPWDDSVELAILAAREAGISVAVAAGNSGGDASNTFFGSLGHSSPWTMVVAASTHDRVMDITNNLIEFTGGNYPPYVNINPSSSWGDDIAGYSTSSIVNATPVVAADFGDEKCLNEFAPGTFTNDQIVICKRGINARVSKAYNVLAGGAGGFILYNEPWYSGITAEEQRVYDDVYPLPGIHVTNNAGKNILKWLKDGASEHTINITGGSVARVIDPSAGDILADFSSLGPSITYSHHLAPNIAAPGVNILAPYADEHPLNPGSAVSQDWNIISGTSMASPHIAGTMALVRQAHPNWTAAEVQSALEMTASQTVRRDVDPDYLPEGHPATQHRAGAGRVDAKAAVDAGLIMDETAANFSLANPHKGGDVRQLNLPQLVNSNCRGGVCSWVRTVTATRDGSWTLSSDTWTYDRWTSTFEGEIDMHNVKMEFFPAHFSLKAGESQSIVIKADIKDVQYQYDSKLQGSGGKDLEGVELWTNVNLTASDASIPKSHWPVSVNFDRQDLPEAVNVTVHRDNGGYQIADLPLAASNDVVYRAHGPVKADIKEVTLPQDVNHQPIYADGQNERGHAQTSLIDIPEGTARFVVEVLAHTDGPGLFDAIGNADGRLAIHIGRDFNGNGEADFDDEWICSSTTQIELNYCSLTNPDAGQYWVMLANTSFNMFDWNEEEGPDPYGNRGITAEDLVDTYKVAIAVVPGGENGLTVTGPAITDGNPVSLDLSWSLAELAEGDVAYAGVDIGSSAAPGSTGFIPVRLERGVDDVSVNNNQIVRGGDTVDVSVHVVENNSGTDRDIDLSTVIPAGLTLVPGSVKVSSTAQQANLTVDGNTIRVAGVQQDSTNWMRTYNVTDSETNDQCRVPNYGRNQGGFVGLAENYGFVPAIGGTMADASGSWDYDDASGQWVYTNPFEINLADLWGDEGHMNLFNNESYTSYNRFIISPQGFVTFGPDWGASSHYLSQPFPYYMNPYGPFVAPFWRGNTSGAAGFTVPVDALGAPLEQNWVEPWKGSGITYAYTGDEVIIEWINARTQGLEASWFGTQATGVEYDDRYTFDLIMNKTYRYGEGEFEIVMAYGDMDFADQDDYGSIGIHGNYGPLDIFGWPYGQETGISAAYNGLKDVVKRNKVICYDYTGPEATQFDVSFQVRVAETAAGQTLNMDFTSDVSGMGSTVIANPIQVASNITLAGFNDVVVDENESFDITVAFADAEANPNMISVSGEHITAVVEDHSAGSSVTITPDANWHGETEVMVTVADSVNSGDKAVRSFMLTVNSDGEELGCTDSTATNYDANANKDDGSCTFPAPPAAEPAKESSGGALGWLALLLAPVAMVRRRKL